MRPLSSIVSGAAVSREFRYGSDAAQEAATARADLRIPGVAGRAGIAYDGHGTRAPGRPRRHFDFENVGTAGVAGGADEASRKVEAMNEQSVELPRAAAPDLKALVRRAKLEDAERSSVVAELRGAEQARLELLRDALEPVFAQVPAQAEFFEHGLVPGEKPSIFVDIVAFIEMARDRRCYRFIQDTRAGTIVLAESDRIEAMSRHVANYLARRLIEREKALSAPLPNFQAQRGGRVGGAR